MLVSRVRVPSFKRIPSLKATAKQAAVAYLNAVERNIRTIIPLRFTLFPALTVLSKIFFVKLCKISLRNCKCSPTGPRPILPLSQFCFVLVRQKLQNNLRDSKSCFFIVNRFFNSSTNPALYIAEAQFVKNNHQATSKNGIFIQAPSSIAILLWILLVSSLK